MKRSYNIQDDQGDGFCPKVMLVERNSAPNGVALLSAERVAKKDCNELVKLAMEIEKGDSAVHATACNKLQIIAQQIKFLQQQATSIINELKSSQDLHHAACNFVKVPGNIYHLYKRQSGQNYFSMLSPQEWPNCPHDFLGSYRLEHNQSWTSTDSIDEVNKEYSIINRIIGGTTNIGYALQESPMES